MRTIEYGYDLSPIQKGMLFHYLLAEQPGVEIEQVVGALHEELDTAAFRRAWERVAARHEAFRTALRWKGLDTPQQEVYSRVDLPFLMEDWRSRIRNEQEQRLEEYLRSDRILGFELDRAPLVRLALFRLADDDYRLVLTAHHVLMDGRSFPVLLREAFAWYEALRSSTEVVLSPPVSFREHVLSLGQRDRSNDEMYWRERLAGFGSAGSLVIASAGPPEEASGGERREQEVRLSRDVTDRLIALAREHGLRLSTLVHGAWAILLSRYCGEERVVFGSVRSCRSQIAQGQSRVGVFINTVPVPVRVSPGSPLVSWLQRLREEQLAGRPYEQTPLVDVQRWSEVPPGDALLKSIVIFDHARIDSFVREATGDWSGREFRLLDKTSFPITLCAYAEPELFLSIVYDSSAFAESAVRCTLGHLRTLLEGMASDPDAEVGALPILTENERERQLVDWNSTAVGFPRERCIHDLIEQQVRLTPDHTAAVFDDESLSYRELNERANGLAVRLRQLGVGPEVLVAICLERSLEMLVSVLAVLKAGAAYLPLDSDLPDDRLAFIMKDARAPVLITQASLAPRIPITRASVVLLDDGWNALPREENSPTSGATPRNLAYVIYTSGSTGKPKGVMIEHHSVVNFFTGMSERIVRGDRGTWLALTRLSFDISVLELLWTLTQGDEIVIGRDQARSSWSRGGQNGIESENTSVATLVRRHQVTGLQCTPSLARMLIADNETRAALRSLRTLLIGGEALSGELARELSGLVSGEVINMYGPTETTIWSSTDSVDGSSATVSIGRPIANTEFYVLDKSRQPVPVGVSGELYIGGEGVARGYLHRTELTASHFVQNPFGEGRLYRTGDMVRYREDGRLDFLGRTDHQVKIRGHRIELGEIETVLSRHPAIREAVVGPGESSQGGPSLVAYYVRRRGASVKKHELAELCERKLPRYMVPGLFVGLDAFPLTPNRKIDRRALPAAVPTRGNLAQAFVAPRTSAEKILAHIWQTTLGLDGIGIHDDFFDLGGNSLSSIQATLRIRQTFNAEVPLNAIFKASTVAGMVEFLDASTTAPARTRL